MPTPQGIPEHELKQNSGVSASMALQAMQKAWELRQAANAAGDPQAREEILAKAINKEIEAESFGKAAKYTQSGTFQGLAAGAGLGVQPGVTLGKVTGALVGGVVSTVTGLLGGGVGSVYGAINGPFWDLGQMASQGVRGVVGDFPNWSSTPAQKKALEKMVMQTSETQAPSQKELEEMKAQAPDDMPQTWSQSAKDVTSWRPSVPSMPSVPKASTLGLGGLGAAMPSWGGKATSQDQQKVSTQPSQPRTRSQKQATNKQPSTPKEAPTPKQAPTAKEAPPPKSQKAPTSKTTPKAQPNPSSTKPTPSRPTAPKQAPPKPSQPQSSTKPTPSGQVKRTSSSGEKETKPSSSYAAEERKKPRKLTSKTTEKESDVPAPAPRRTPRKIGTRKA
ncbi:hypothetical protein P153DRAFT_371488 [Dothidotthia symphoricarpi CBS 119687]|uniref:Uncharacterized protein n=1 Tax=Dothidotthia symphoricarpi CBS 119687 TaxID=1392245 RepID=A0A6A5ZXP7_9PLEO|nr:uncharacterized protein P153DRAFT_371488 [Dothidotthia symphoricarpi CBS 119687]KAF2123673.1 hypothetical protein P153DRAFT_371488 [Dothidotthia symphoricarpi CBS 119687]